MAVRTLVSFVVAGAATSLVASSETARVTVAVQGAPQHPGPATVDVSANGRFVAFESAAALVTADRNSCVDIYVLDRTSGAVTLESVTADGSAATGSSAHPRLSGDGRFM